MGRPTNIRGIQLWSAIDQTATAARISTQILLRDTVVGEHALLDDAHDKGERFRVEYPEDGDASMEIRLA